MEKKSIEIGCEYCVIPKEYKSANFELTENNHHICNYCRDYKKQEFKGKEQLKKDINLKQGEKVGVMVSGGKDGLYAWMLLCDIFGSENVIAFNHHKTGLVHPLAYENIISASKLLKSKVVIIKDDEFLNRFKKNLESLIKNPDPAMVRVALCAGCRYGITGLLYQKAEEEYNITKFVSAASYLELAPFKDELLKEKGNGNSKYGLIKGLSENENYNYADNIDIILRDDNLVYKNKKNAKTGVKNKFKEYKLFDLDEYIENVPNKYEEEVVKRLNWKRPEKSWHFDCIVEDFKEFFYYGCLGYTEYEFKLSQMIRYELISREDAIKSLSSYQTRMNNSLNKILEKLDYLEMDYLKKQFIDFYKNSKYFLDNT